ncbi:MAG: pilus assembly protein TadG-related protein [Ktedonobacterales bacterium]
MGTLSGYSRMPVHEQPPHGGRDGVRRLTRLRTLAARRAQWRRRGQTLVIFALSLTVLIAMLGLSIDTIRVFDLYGRMQRAAEAAALAGVIYMPNNYTTNLNQPPGDNAICRALQEAIKDGFGQPCGSSNLGGYCPANTASVEVTICAVPGKQFDLRVSITESADVLFLSALNVGPVTLTASAQAEYLPPVPIGLDASGSGANLGTFGGYGDCNGANGTNPVACTGGYHQQILANINGPADLKQMGDPYVACEEGAAHTASLDQPVATLPTYTGYTGGAANPGILTNHPQFTTDYSTLLASHCNANNSDRQAFYGPQTQNTSHPGAYSYMVDATQNASLWIYNAPFVPTNGGAQPCTGKQQLDGFNWYTNPNAGSGGAGCEGFYQQYGPSAFNGFFDNPAYYYNVTYTLYRVTNVSAPLADTTPIATYQAHPFDGMQPDLAKYGCTGSQVVDIDTLQCVSQPNGQWGYLPLAQGLSQGVYRVEVEATAHVPGATPSGWGVHTYGLKLCPTGVSASGVAGCDAIPGNVPGFIGGWNDADMTLFYPTTNGVTGFPLGVIPTEYAGRMIDVSLFDAGDPANIGSSGNTFIYLAPPNPSNNNQSSCATNETALENSLGYSTPDYGWADSRVVPLFNAGLSNPNSALQTSANGDNAFNGIWVDITTRLPSTYVQGQWTLCGAITNGQGDSAQDTLAIAISSPGQSPVHLVA